MIQIADTVCSTVLHDAAPARQASRRIAPLVETVLGSPLDSPAPLGLDGVKHRIVEELGGAVVVSLAHQLGPAQVLIRSAHRHVIINIISTSYQAN